MTSIALVGGVTLTWALFAHRVINVAAQGEIPLPLRLDIVSTVALVLAFPIALLAGSLPQAIATTVLLVTLAVHAYTDRRYESAFEELTIPALVVCAACAFSAHREAEALLGLVVAGVIIGAVHYGTKGEKFGFPDVAIAMLIGLALGPFGFIGTLLLGTLITVPWYLTHGGLKTACPYASDACIGSFATCIILPIARAHVPALSMPIPL